MSKKKLSDEELNKLKESVAENIALQRTKLLTKHQFIGGVIMHLEMVPIRDYRVRTACTDGKHVYFDLAFYSELTDDERQFVLAHETWHCVYMHMLRKKSRDQILWNYATDMEINRMLESDGFVAPAEVLFPDPKWKEGISAEEMYELLLKDIKKKMKQASAGSKQSAGNSGGNSSSSDDGDGSEDSDSSASDGIEKKYAKGSGKKDGKVKGQFDDHVYEGQDRDSMKSKKPTDKWGEVGEDPDFTPTVDRRTAERIREAVMASAERCERMQGKLPAGVKDYLEKLRKPTISWREYLSQFVTACLGDKRQWLPVNRRHVYNDIYLQSRRSERIEGIVAIDTSGSCIDELPKFFGELKGLIDTFGNYKLTVIQADAAVDQVDEYDPNERPFAPEVADHIEWSGGGGTDYGPVFKYIDDKGLDPDFVVYLGDGFCDFSYNKKPTFPVLWVLTEDGNEDFCDFGLKIHLNNDDYDEYNNL